MFCFMLIIKRHVVSLLRAPRGHTTRNNIDTCKSARSPKAVSAQSKLEKTALMASIKAAASKAGTAGDRYVGYKRFAPHMHLYFPRFEPATDTTSTSMFIMFIPKIFTKT